MSHHLFGLYICYWCSVLQDGEFSCSLEYIGILLQVSVSLSHFWGKVGKRKEPVDIPPCRSICNSHSLRNPMADVLLLQNLHSQIASLEKCQFHSHVTTGPARAGDGSREWQIWCPQHIHSWEEMFGCICVRREKQQLLIGSLRHIQVHHHTKQTVSSQIKKPKKIKKPPKPTTKNQTTTTNQTKTNQPNKQNQKTQTNKQPKNPPQNKQNKNPKPYLNYPGTLQVLLSNAQWPNAQGKESAGKEMNNWCFPSFLWDIWAVKACYDCTCPTYTLRMKRSL